MNLRYELYPDQCPVLEVSVLTGSPISLRLSLKHSKPQDWSLILLFQYNLHDPTWPQLCWRGGALGQQLPGEEVSSGQWGHQSLHVPHQLRGEERPPGQPQPQLQTHQQHEVCASDSEAFVCWNLWCLFACEGNGSCFMTCMLITPPSSQKLHFPSFLLYVPDVASESPKLQPCLLLWSSAV